MTHQTSVTKHKDLHKGLVFVVMWSEPLEIGKSDIALSFKIDTVVWKQS